MWSFAKLLIWGTLWIIIGPAMKVIANKDNCLTWAVSKWNSDGGYLVIRWGVSNKYSWLRWPHFLWLDEKYHTVLQHYMPVEENPADKHTLPAPWFDGKETVGDSKDAYEN